MCVCIYTYMYIFTCTYTKICIHVCAYIYIYVYIFTCTYTYFDIIEQDDRERHVPQSLLATGWRRPIGCLELQVICRKRATNYRAFLRKMTYKKLPYFFCGKWPITRHLMGLRHHVLNLLNRSTAELTCKLTKLSRCSIILFEILKSQLATPPKNRPGTVVWTLIILSRLIFTTNSKLRRIFDLYHPLDFSGWVRHPIDSKRLFVQECTT